VQVIDSLAEITRYQDREILEKSLLETLSETVPSEEYRLYKVQRPPPKLELTVVANKTTNRDVISENQTSHQLTKSLQQAISDSIEREDVVTFESGEHHHRGTIFPVLDKNGDTTAVLLQFTDNIRFDEQRIVFGLLRIYSNYLNLLHENVRDKLTGLLNRETLNKEILKILMEKSHTKKKIESRGFRRASDDVQYWLGVIDVDHFKAINDKFGHLFGDEVLILMASYMTEVFRDDDLIFRYGGEEFVVLIKVLNRDDAYNVFERLRKKILQHQFPQVESLAVSIGMVELNEQEGSSDVIHSADKALYYAKDHGRNQTCIYEDLINAGKIISEQKIKPREIDLF
jgi:diguanylate cyclase (GGDEF)-like protein